MEVKINEIRVGNIFIGYYDKLFKWGLKEFSFIEPDVAISIDEIIKSTVEISEEILLNVGFSNWPHIETCFHINFGQIEFVLFSTNTPVGIANNLTPNCFYFFFNSTAIEVKFIHELQNFISSLTGQELDVSKLI